MPLRTIAFPQLQLALRRGDLELSMQTSVILNLSDSISDLNSYSDLVEAVEGEQLWIARHGSSYFTVALEKETVQLSALERVMVTDWIESHEIWSRLGLRMVASNSDYNPTQISWSIQHPDLTSVLAPPEQAKVAEFREVRCIMKLKHSDSDQQSAKRAKRRKIKEEEVESKEHSFQGIESESNGFIQEQFYDSLDPVDQRMIDEFLKRSRSPTLIETRAEFGKRKIHAAARNDPPLEGFRGLLEGALEVVLFGSLKRVKGIKALYDAEVQGLTHLLPGVFHMPHLKAIAERASFLPIIATSLARMANAESPSLRRKASDFQYGQPYIDIHASSSKKITRGIETATWRTLLRNVRTPALNPKSASPPAQQPLTPLSSTSERQREATFVLGDMFASQASSSSEGLTLEQWKPRLHPGTPASEVKAELTFSCATPMTTPRIPGHDKERQTSTTFCDSLLPVAAPAVSSPFSTPTLQIFGSSITNAPMDLQHTHAQPLLEFPKKIDTPLSGFQGQQSLPFVPNNTQQSSSASQDQNCYPLSSQVQDIYPMQFRNMAMGLNFPSEAISQGLSSGFPSFGDLLGDASMTEWCED